MNANLALLLFAAWCAYGIVRCVRDARRKEWEQ